MHKLTKYTMFSDPKVPKFFSKTSLLPNLWLVQSLYYNSEGEITFGVLWYPTSYINLDTSFIALKSCDVVVTLYHSLEFSKEWPPSLASSVPSYPHSLFWTFWYTHKTKMKNLNELLYFCSIVKNWLIKCNKTEILVSSSGVKSLHPISHISKMKIAIFF